ncbi:hypothetical protein CVT24_009171 [Panaeolus cyanescens]|uniref:Uncharacterized protein n=1 Tax=Panaeolus cyanescens TaxID=181874 RepID=A0A409Y8V2_9AGAR|nr:hypothetical protein CVT24_009171 [Panaeolus cyanescens]
MQRYLQTWPNIILAKQGLQSIISSGTIDINAPENVREDMIRRTRVFYFNQTTGSNISMEDAARVELGFTQTAAQQPPETDETRVLSFAELKELIESGNVDKIPNNKIIPEAINDAPPSESVTPARKKPWEIAAQATSSTPSGDSTSTNAVAS